MATLVTIAIPSKGNLEFDFAASLITAEDTIDTLEAQELANAIRDAEAFQVGMAFDSIAFMGGKNDLGNNVFTGIIIELLNDWRIISGKTSGSFLVTGGSTIKTTTAGEIFAPNNLVSQINLLAQAGSISVVAVNSVEQELTYDGMVHINTTSGNTGTVYPNGTLADPVDNLTDALAIASIYGIKVLNLHTDLALDQAVVGFQVKGCISTIVTLGGWDISNSQFENITITGAMNATVFNARNCKLDSITNMIGAYHHCEFINTTAHVIAASATVSLLDCASEVPGASSPTLDYTNGGISLSLRRYSGGMQIINSTDAGNTTTLEFLGGALNLASSNTAGTLHARGSFSLLDNSAGLTLVTDARTADFTTENLSKEELIRKIIEMNLI